MRSAVQKSAAAVGALFILPILLYSLHPGSYFESLLPIFTGNTGEAAHSLRYVLRSNLDDHMVGEVGPRWDCQAVV